MRVTYFGWYPYPHFLYYKGVKTGYVADRLLYCWETESIRCTPILEVG